MNALHRIGHTAARALGLGQHECDGIEAPLSHPAWISTLPVGELATDAVALASLAMNLVHADRTGRPLPVVRVHGDRVAASFGSERLFRINGQSPTIWSPLSGFWRTRDGWVRTHGNYHHHADRLRTLIGVSAAADREQVAEALLNWRSEDLESRAATVGALVTAVRTPAQWRAHPHAKALARTPLIARRTIPDAPARQWPDAPGTLPLTGIRVLDLTRVIAGPVATRDLALAGADVLRVDSPTLPEPAWQHLDTGQGKRSTLLDLRVPEQRATFEELLETADILVTGYRPGALDPFGLDADSLHARHPGLVIGRISAWGAVGPWRDRRGFDSLVQAATGIAHCERKADNTPGALPVQALDHSAGHSLAAAVALALREQRRTGGTIEVGIALARIAQELLEAPATEATAPQPDASDLPTVTANGITCAPPALAFEGAPTEYARVGGGWGADPPRWEPT